MPGEEELEIDLVDADEFGNGGARVKPQDFSAKVTAKGPEALRIIQERARDARSGGDDGVPGEYSPSPSVVPSRPSDVPRSFSMQPGASYQWVKVYADGEWVQDYERGDVDLARIEKFLYDKHRSRGAVFRIDLVDNNGNVKGTRKIRLGSLLDDDDDGDDNEDRWGGRGIFGSPRPAVGSLLHRPGFPVSAARRQETEEQKRAREEQEKRRQEAKSRELDLELRKMELEAQQKREERVAEDRRMEARRVQEERAEERRLQMKMEAEAEKRKMEMEERERARKAEERRWEAEMRQRERESEERKAQAEKERRDRLDRWEEERRKADENRKTTMDTLLGAASTILPIAKEMVTARTEVAKLELERARAEAKARQDDEARRSHEWRQLLTTTAIPLLKGLLEQRNPIDQLSSLMEVANGLRQPKSTLDTIAEIATELFPHVAGNMSDIIAAAKVDAASAPALIAAQGANKEAKQQAQQAQAQQQAQGDQGSVEMVGDPPHPYIAPEFSGRLIQALNMGKNPVEFVQEVTKEGLISIEALHDVYKILGAPPEQRDQLFYEFLQKVPGLDVKAFLGIVSSNEQVKVFFVNAIQAFRGVYVELRHKQREAESGASTGDASEVPESNAEEKTEGQNA